MMTEERTPFKAEGSLNADLYARILSLIYQHRVSGLLSLTKGEEIKKIHLRQGFIVYASTTLEEERLGDILLAKGIISKQDYDQSSTLIKETGKKQGTLLVSMGAITPRQLFQGHILQVSEIALSPLRWDGGRYSYQTNHQKEEMVYLKIHPGRIVHRGFQEKPLPPNFPGPDTQFTLNPDCPYDIDDLPLSPLEKKILSSADRGKTPADISSFAKLPLDKTLHAFFVLTKTGFLSQPSPAAPVSSEASLENVQEKEVDLREMIDFQNKLVEFHGRLEKMNHYEILGVEFNSPLNEIKRAYITKAKGYHPDRFYRPELESFSPMANEIFMKINEAYNVLAEEESRQKYNQTILKIMDNSKAETARDLSMAAEQFKKGLRLMKCGENREASEALKWAVRMCPDNPLYHSYLGLALMKTGHRLKQAEEHMKTAITLDYSNPQYYVNLGLIYKKGRVLKKAEESFRRALRLDPRHKEALEEIKKLDKRENPPREDAHFLGKFFKR